MMLPHLLICTRLLCTNCCKCMSRWRVCVRANWCECGYVHARSVDHKFIRERKTKEDENRVSLYFYFFMIVVGVVAVSLPCDG